MDTMKYYIVNKEDEIVKVLKLNNPNPKDILRNYPIGYKLMQEII